MAAEEHYREAVAAALLASDEQSRALLQAIADTARAIFGAAATSIFLLDEERGDLVFETISGVGSGELIGQRFPAGTGIAGAVVATGEPLVVERVQEDPRFAREAAESTGYQPTSLMAVPLVAGDRTLGVLEVLDRQERSRSPLEELELLGLFAEQAAAGLDLLRRARAARAAVRGADERLAAVERIAAALDALQGPRREAGLRLLQALADVLGGRRV
jgi:GAF domain-containing protein